MPRLHPRARLSARLVGLVLSVLSGAAGAADEAPPREHVVEIAAFAFVPARLEVRRGDSVTWVNRDLAPHTASAEEGHWGSGELRRQDRFRRRFEEAGASAYFCAFHPHMRGEIVVVP